MRHLTSNEIEDLLAGNPAGCRPCQCPRCQGRLAEAGAVRKRLRQAFLRIRPSQELRETVQRLVRAAERPVAWQPELRNPLRAQVEIEAGVCGFRTQATAVSDDGWHVTFDVETDSEKIARLTASLAGHQPLDAFEEISPAGEGVLMATVGETLKGCYRLCRSSRPLQGHAGCRRPGASQGHRHSPGETGIVVPPGQATKRDGRKEMGIYAKYVLPKLMHLACGTRSTMRQRKRVVPLATGRVLEVGAGSGLNLSFYDPRKVERLWALEPSPGLLAMAREKSRTIAFPVDFLAAHAESIPLGDQSAETIVSTYCLCSLADAPAALAEMHRVLRKGGRLLFCEHGRAPDAAVLRWQKLLDPLWMRLAGGCHLGRDIPAMLRAGGFQIRHLNSMYISGWRLVSFNYWGVAE